MKTIRLYIALILIAAIAAGITGCVASVKAGDLMDGMSPNSVNGKPADAAFTSGMADFSLELFKKSITAKENSLISPLSVTLALAMTANGADADTLKQMETLLGGGIRIGELNEYLYSYINRLPNMEKSKLSIANSIWFRDDKNLLHVESDFLQKNADYYNASVFSAAFDRQTVKEINDWVKKNTDGMIDNIIEEIDKSQMLFLINAVAFDAEWATIYEKSSVREDTFTNIHGKKQTVSLMHSTEHRYLEDALSTGFVKPYYNEKYSFVALLPNEGVPIETYIESLTGAGFMNMLRSAKNTIVHASMPKFEYEYEIGLVGVLKDLGMTDAFYADKADFSKMAQSSLGELYIGGVLHKTFIKVDERGTKAGAVTAVIMTTTSAPPVDPPKIVRLDRPFVYAIIDNATNLPVFIGTVMSI